MHSKINITTKCAQHKKSLFTSFVFQYQRRVNSAKKWVLYPFPLFCEHFDGHCNPFETLFSHFIIQKKIYRQQRQAMLIHCFSSLSQDRLFTKLKCNYRNGIKCTIRHSVQGETGAQFKTSVDDFIRNVLYFCLIYTFHSIKKLCSDKQILTDFFSQVNILFFLSGNQVMKQLFIHLKSDGAFFIPFFSLK